jgi:hypothetical protein
MARSAGDGDTMATASWMRGAGSRVDVTSLGYFNPVRHQSLLHQ